MLVNEDLGATNNCVTHAFAEVMNLHSRQLAFSLKVLGNKVVNQDTKEYSLILQDMHGTKHSVTAVRLENIAEVKCAPEIKMFRRMFLNSNKDIRRAFDRPHGNMLGMESRSLLSRDG